MEKLGLLPKCGGNKPDKCEVCVQAKLTRKPFSSVTRSTNLLDLIHSDTCDFKSFVTRGGKKYFITFIDDHSRFFHVYLLKSKDEAFSKFVEFRSWVEKQLGLQVKKLRSDRGGEYRSKELDAYFKEHGIITKTTTPYSSQSNRIAERKNHTLTEMVNLMLITSGLPTCYWREALLMANWILNRVSYSKLNSTPHQLWLEYPDSLDNIKVWGVSHMFEYQISEGLSSDQRQTNTCFLSLLEIAMRIGSWTLEPTPSLKLEIQNSLRISLSKIKVYC